MGKQDHGNQLLKYYCSKCDTLLKETISYRVVPIEKYREMVLDAAETVLGLFGFDRTIYENYKKKGRKKWYEELREERTKETMADVE